MKTCLRKSHTFLVIFLSFSFVSGCALFRENSGPTPSFTPRDQFFFSNYDNVWRMAQIAMQAYPMRINNMDSGIIETESIRGYKVWTPPFKTELPSGGLSYYINIHIVKGMIDGREAIKVSVSKNTEITQDFFSEPKKLPSDGLEEKAILYRIGRELQIEKALEKALKKAKAQ